MVSLVRHFHSGSFGTLAVLAVALFSAVPGLTAQETGVITGEVRDARTGEPLAAVQVFIQDLSIGELTQQNGRYELQDVPAGTHTLTAQRLGYESASQEVTVGAGASVVPAFSLSEQALSLDEVVVTGTPGGTQRRALGNSLVGVDASVIVEQMAVPNMRDMLEGRAPGVDFTAQVGDVGAGSAIRVRGFGSLSLNQTPLIYVDGIRVRNDLQAGPNLQSGPAASTLNDLNPHDIESIEIVKGAAAATLYGTEASAGVIQIITKKGLAGDPQFDLSIRQGTNFMKDPVGRLGEMWGCTTGELPCAEENLFAFNIYENEEQVTGKAPFGYGLAQDYNLAMRGGTSSYRYYASAGWSDREGIVDWNSDRKFTGRANITAIPTENLTLDFSTGYVDGDTRFAQGMFPGGVWGNLLFASPTPEELSGPRRGWFMQTPEEAATGRTTRSYQRFTGSVTAQHTFGDWLTQRAIVGIDRAWDQNEAFVPRHSLGSEGPFESDSRGLIDLSEVNETNVSLEYSLTAEYVRNGWLSFQTSAGGQYYQEKAVGIDVEGRDFTSEFVSTIDGAAEFDPPSQNFFETKSFGVYLQEQIGINDRIFLTAALRGDDHSAFGDQFDIIYYPKLSGTWVISEEPFFDAQDVLGFVTELRLRGAWGEAGRQPGVVAGMQLFESTLATGGRRALVPSNIGNPNVGAERTSEIELGADAAFFDNRLSLDFTYFRQTVSQALTNQSLAPSEGFAGYGSRQTNLAELAVRGWEASLDARLIEMNDFAFEVLAAGDHTRNWVVSLGPDVLGGQNFDIGLGYPSIVDSSVLLGFDLDENGNPINLMCDSGTGPSGRERGGEPKPCDEVPLELMLGRGDPAYTFSVIPTFTFFNDLQLFGMFDGEHGAWVADVGMDDRSNARRGGQINSRAGLLRNDPWFVAANDIPGFADDRWRGRYDASFWKLREVGLRYRTPDSWAQALGGESLSLGLTAREVWTLWQKTTHDLTGVRVPDPEIRSPSPNADNTFRQMPPLSSVTFTVNFSF